MNDQCLDLTTVILTFNEDIHIKRCIDNIKSFSQDIIVVDSFSTDQTVEIAKDAGATVYQNKWENNYAKQFNWALDNCNIKTKWVLRLDADEYLLPETIQELRNKLNDLSDDVSGIVIKRRHIFLNKWMKRGTYPIKLLRVFKYGLGRCEQRMMDEHILLTKGTTIELNYDFVDHNLNDLSWWAHKHVNYAIREAVDLLNIEMDLCNNTGSNKKNNIGEQANLKRNKKTKYSKLPLFWRAIFYFLYRYIWKCGFLEGKEGFCWHFFQGLWYRMFVDLKILEIKNECGNDPEKIRDYISDHYHIALK